MYTEAPCAIIMKHEPRTMKRGKEQEAGRDH